MSKSDVQDGDTPEETGVLVLDPNTSYCPEKDHSSSKEIKQSEDTDATESNYKKSAKTFTPEKHTSSKKGKHNVTSKLSSTVKKSSSDIMAMTSVDIEPRKASAIPANLAQITPMIQPIPPDAASVSQLSEIYEKIKTLEDKAAKEESPTDEITEMQALPTPKHSEWALQETELSLENNRYSKKKEISWNDDEYLDKVQLKVLDDASRVLALERKASVGPFKPVKPFVRASGLTLCVPKKSARNISNSCDVGMGINISISRKSLIKNIKSGVAVNADVKNSGDSAKHDEKRAVKVDIDIPYLKIFSMVRNKLVYVRNKFHISRSLPV